MSRKQPSRTAKLINLAVCLSLLLCTGPGWAQVVKPVSVQQGEEEKLIALNFQDAPLEVIIDHYAEVTGRTILQSPAVPAGALITLRGQQKLTETEFLGAIESVLAMHNIALVPMGDKFLKVIPAAEIRTHGMAIETGSLPEDAPDTDKLESRIIELQHLEIAEIQPIIDTLKHPYAKVQPLERANSLLITETTTNLKRIMEIIEMLDKPLATKMEVRIYELQYADVGEISSRLNELVQQSQQAQEASRRTAGRAAPPPAGTRGVIRAGTTAARTAARTAATVTEEALAEQGLVQGTVTFVADERTNILIVISKPSNFVFFDKIIDVLDIPVEPEIQVEVVALEYASAEELGNILNEFIGAATSDSGASDAARGDDAQQGGTARSTALQEYIARRNAAQSAIQRAQTTAARGGGEEANFGRLSENTRILPDERTNSLLLMGNQDDIEILRRVIDELDVMLAQVLIEALILEVQLGDDIEFGIDWLQRSFTVYNEETRGPGGGVSVRQPVLSFGGAQRLNDGSTFLDASQITRDTAFSPGALTYYATLFDLNIDAVIRLAASTSDSRILSTPVIMTTDNKEANLFIGESRPTVTSTSITGGGVDRSTYQYTEIGIELTITPHINPQRFVVLEITQTADNVGGFELIDGNRVPIITRREMQAEIAVQHRSTVVLGGLVSSDERKTRSKVPILGDIPVLGSLFRFDSNERVDTELIVLITPYVMMSPEETFNETQRLYDRTFASEELPGHTWSDTKILWQPDEPSMRPLDPLFERSGSSRSLESMGAEGRRLVSEGDVDPESAPFTSEELYSTPQATPVATQPAVPMESEPVTPIDAVAEDPVAPVETTAPAAVVPAASEEPAPDATVDAAVEAPAPVETTEPAAAEPAPVLAPPPVEPEPVEVDMDDAGLNDPVPFTAEPTAVEPEKDAVAPPLETTEKAAEEPAPEARTPFFQIRMGDKDGVPPLDLE